MTIARHCGIWFAVLILVPPRQAPAQAAPAPAGRVRVMDAAHSAPLAIGELVRVAGDTVVIVSADRTSTALVLAQGRQLEVSAGVHGRTITGIGVGLLVGAALGAAIGYASYQEPDCAQSGFCIDFGPGMSAAAGAALFSLPGMLIGGIAGSKSRHETWRPLDHRTVHVRVAPAGTRGVQFGVSVGF